MTRFALHRAPAAYDDTFMETMASEYLERTPWTELRLEAVRDLVEPDRGDRIIDLGCAAGAIAHYLSTFGCSVVGVDAEERAIAKANELFPGPKFAVADVSALPFPDAAFDKAVAADLVEHLDDQTFDAMLLEVRRVLRPGGSFTLYTPNAKHVIERLKARDLVLAQNPTHIGLRDARTLRRHLETAGLTVDRDEWRPSFFRGLRALEHAAGPRVESLRYRLALRAFKPA